MLMKRAAQYHTLMQGTAITQAKWQHPDIFYVIYIGPYLYDFARQFIKLCILELSAVTMFKMSAYDAKTGT